MQEYMQRYHYTADLCFPDFDFFNNGINFQCHASVIFLVECSDSENLSIFQIHEPMKYMRY